MAAHGGPEATERVTQREQQGDRAGVVVGAGVHLAMDHPAVIVVRDQHHPVGVSRGGAIDRADVDAVGSGAAAIWRGRLLEPPVEERYEAGRLQAPDEIRPGSRAALAPAQASLERGRGERPHVGLERGRVERGSGGDGVLAGAWRAGGLRRVVDELVPQRRQRARRAPGQKARGHERDEGEGPASQWRFRKSRATATCMATPAGRADSLTIIRLEWLGGAGPSAGRVPRKAKAPVTRCRT